MLEVRDISYHIGEARILRGISARFEPGTLSVIVGPNGSGKSTLLRAMSGENIPSSGAVFYGTTSLPTIRPQDRARMRAVLSQRTELTFPLTVTEIVMMGRYPHFLVKPSNKDYEIVRSRARTNGHTRIWCSKLSDTLRR